MAEVRRPPWLRISHYLQQILLECLKSRLLELLGIIEIRGPSGRIWRNAGAADRFRSSLGHQSRFDVPPPAICPEWDTGFLSLAHSLSLLLLERSLLKSLHGKIDVDVAASSMRVRTDFLVSLACQRFKFGLGNRGIHHLKLDCQSKSARGAGADRDAAGYRCTLRIELLLTGNVIQCPAKTGRISGRKQMLGRRCAGLSGTPHGFGNRQIYAYRTIIGRVCPLRPPIAVAVAVKSGLISIEHPSCEFLAQLKLVPCACNREVVCLYDRH